MFRLNTQGIIQDGKLTLAIPEGLLEDVSFFINRYPDLTVTIEKLRLKRTTGPHSQNRRINGFIQQIAESTGNDFSTVKDYCKREAISEGYPAKYFKGDIFPKSESEISISEAVILIATIERLAAEYGIILKEC